MPVDTKISALPAAPFATSSDELAVNQSGTTRKATLAQISASIGSLGSGKVVQEVFFQTGAVATGSTIIPLDDTIPQQTEGDLYMSLPITPISATNRLRIDVVLFITSSGGNWLLAALFQDAIANALAAGWVYQNIGTGGCCIKFTHHMPAGTTSATTFKVRAGAQAGGTTTFNGAGGTRHFGGVMSSSITITELIP